MDMQTVWSTYVDLGATAYKSGQYDIAETMLKAAAREAHKLKQGYEPLALVLENLGATFAEQKRYPKAERLFKRAMIMHERNLGEINQHCSRLLVRLVETYLLQSKFSLAERDLVRAIEIAEQCSDVDRQQMIRLLVRVASLWNEYGQIDAACGVYKHVLALRIQLRNEAVANAVQSTAMEASESLDSDEQLEFEVEPSPGAVEAIDFSVDAVLEQATTTEICDPESAGTQMSENFDPREHLQLNGKTEMPESLER